MYRSNLIKHSWIVLLFLSWLAFAQPKESVQPQRRFVRGHILVKFKEGVSDQRVTSILAAKRARKNHTISGIGIHVVDLPANADEEAFVNDLKAQGDVEFAEVDQILSHQSITPNDTYYAYERYLPQIQAPSAWSISTGSTSVTIALIDTGVYPFHPDLRLKLVAGWNIFDNNSSTVDVTGQGTWAAGVNATSNNSGGVAGVCWGCMLMPVRVSDTTGKATVANIASGITWAADHGAKIANLGYSATDSSVVSSAAQYLWNKGGITVAPSGNDSTFDSSPDNPYILTVGATDAYTSTNTIWSHSNTGNNIDLVAPDTAFYTTLNGGSYGTDNSGTCVSAAMVSGVAGLVWSVNPSLTPAQLTSVLEQSATDLGPSGWDSSYGWGLVNAYKAVTMATSGGAGGGGTKTSTTTTIASSLNPSTSGQSVTLSAMVSPSTATGSITFLDGTTTVGSVTLSAGKASLATSTLSAGTHALTASYGGDANNNSSKSATLTQTVTTAAKTNTSATLVSSLNPSTLGQPVTFTATVSPASATGTVTFLDGAASIGNLSLAAGKATFTTSGLVVGTHSITASYAGDSSNNGSTSSALIQTVSASNQPLAAPILTSAFARSATEVDLSWTASPSAAGYQITRSGFGPITVSSSTLSYADISVTPVTSYTYFVRAYDSAGNFSAASRSMQVITPASSATTSCPSPGSNTFVGCYFDNINLSGSPAFVRTDSQINFNWGATSPDKSLAPASFSVRWQGYFTFSAGTYTFNATTSDGMRVYVDGKILIDQWHDQGTTIFTATDALSQGTHLVVVEYYEHTNKSIVAVSWH